MGASVIGQVVQGQATPRPAPHVLKSAPWPPAAALIVVCLVFGGSSQGNALSAALAEVAGVGGLLWTAWRRRGVGIEGRVVPGVAFIGCVAALLLAQMIPLPPALWSALPGRAALAADLRLAGEADVWRPISLAPEATWRGLLALAPAAAVFLMTLDVDVAGRRKLAGVVLLVALGSVLLAALQLAGGPYSPLRFYAITNADSGVGLFANRNHLASLLVVSMPPAAALAVDWGMEGRRGSMVWVAASLGVYLLLMVGVGVSLSRAGMLLLAPAVLASLAIAQAGRGRYRRRPAALLLVAASVIGLFLVGAFSLAAVAQRFHQEGATDIRFQAAPVVAQMANRYMPLGAGLGAFEPAYRAAEPLALLLPNYLNHAHDDYLEVWLEAGVAGVLAVLAFIAWWARASWKAWAAARARGVASLLPAAASASVGLLLLHSLVDYPLRTIALSAVLAFCCAVLTPAPASVEE